MAGRLIVDAATAGFSRSEYMKTEGTRGYGIAPQNVGNGITFEKEYREGSYTTTLLSVITIVV